MKISIIGAGYVGLVTAACLAEVGNHVLCLDADPDKVAKLQTGIVTIHEPGLTELIQRNQRADKLRFTTDVRESSRHGRIQFIAVGTPAAEDGSSDLNYVLAAAESIARHMETETIIVNKSTVPVGTADRVHAAVSRILSERGVSVAFDVVSNPEFLKEGAAIADFQRPDRIVIGTDSERATTIMKHLYTPFTRHHDKLMFMDVRSAELTKYASNAMLATRISFMNELANLADAVGADIESVRLGMGSDSRIGYSFLYAGIGYGGSCFPKDIKALIHTAQHSGRSLHILSAVERVNDAQKSRLTTKIIEQLGDDLTGFRFALWGLAFKPNTNDMREAPSRTLISELVARGASICAYDPVATAEARRVISAPIDYAASALEALEGADALIIATEWKEFQSPDFDLLSDCLRTRIIFDGRNMYDPQVVEQFGLTYIGIGRASQPMALVA